MRANFVGLLLVMGAGCATGRATSPTVVPSIVGQLEEEPAPEAEPEPIPIAVRKLVASQKAELADMRALAAVVGDATGRVRAQREVATLADELSAVERGILAADSDVLDDAVERLLRLDSKIHLLHDRLRTALPDPGLAKAQD